MRIYSSFVFALAILFSCIAITTPSFAKILECERYRTSGENYFEIGAYDSWFPKKISLDPKKFKTIPGAKSISFHQNSNFVHNGPKVKVELKLLPTGVLIKSSARLQGEARYKCNMKPEEVLAAQTKKSALQKCLDGDDVLTSCTNKQLCGYATSSQWIKGQQKKAWDTSERWKKYVVAAKARGLSCGVSEASSQSTTQSSTSNTTLTPSKADKSKAFCKDIGFTAGTEKFGECVLKMMDK